LSAAHDACPDPLVADVRTWIAEWNEADALMREFKDLETALIDKHGGMTTAEAIARGIPEGFVMRSLERRCDAIDRKLERDAERIVQTRAKRRRAPSPRWSSCLKFNRRSIGTNLSGR
jgi:hypothetical protein